MNKLADTWKVFTAAPHRVMFFGGGVQIVAAILWWLFELVTRHGMAGPPINWSIMPGYAHLYLTVFSLFILYIFGFVMTTFPRWMGGREIRKSIYVTSFVLLMTGNMLFYAGLATQQIVLQLALIISLSGWAVGIYALLRVVLDTPPSDKINPLVILLSLLMGWLGLLSYLFWLVSDNVRWVQLAAQLGIWLFLVPLFVSVGHRMIPFFTKSALPHASISRPDWPWWVLLAGSAAHGVLQFYDAAAWLWLADAPATLAAFQLSYSWGFRQSFKNAMLSILHLGFAWLGVALLLYTIQSAVIFASNESVFILGLAPLHALTIGCFATLVIGMGTRVTFGHSGMPFIVNPPLKLMFAGVQFAAILRILADVVPQQHNHWLYLLSALLWLLCFTPWVWRFLPAYWKVRVDGKPG